MQNHNKMQDQPPPCSQGGRGRVKINKVEGYKCLLIQKNHNKMQDQPPPCSQGGRGLPRRSKAQAGEGIITMH